jgi:butyryl-CoA dehydrogenase
MNFEFTEEQLAVQEVARAFAEKRLKPRAEEFDAEAKMDRAVLKELGDLGLMGVALPEEYGGAGMDAISYAITAEELARGCVSHTGVVTLHNSLFGFPLVHFGTDAQKQKYLPPVCSGEKIGVFALSEPNAGSDAAALSVTYTETDDGYLLNGTKIFITMGAMSDYAVVFAIKEKGAGPKGISAFLVDRETEGYDIGTTEKKLGWRASPTSELVFTDCLVPKENLLGKEGEGFKVAMSTLDGGRISVGALSLGIAQEALAIAVKYAQEREQFGRPIAKFQMIQYHLAEMSSALEAARWLVYRAAWLKDAGQPLTQAAAQAKLVATEMATLVTHRAIQVLGGYGYCREYQVERLYRDARAGELFEGTNEIQRLVIARNLMNK